MLRQLTILVMTMFTLNFLCTLGLAAVLIFSEDVAVIKILPIFLHLKKSDAFFMFCVLEYEFTYFVLFSEKSDGE